MKLRKLDPNAGAVPPRPSSSGRLTVPLPLPPFSNRPPEAKQTESNSPIGTEATSNALESSGSIDRTLSIAVDLIDPHPIPPRTIYSDETILERAESLRTEGQLNPIHVMPNPKAPGRYIIIDGWTRVQACVRHRALPELRAEVHTDLNLDEAAWFGWQSNEGREQHCDYDRAVFFESLIREGMSQAEISRRSGYNKTAITMYRGFAKLPGEVIDYIVENPRKFGHRAAYELSRIFDATQSVRKTLAIALKFVTEDKSVGWVMTQAQAFVTPNKPKQPPPNKKVIRYANGSYKQTADVFSLNIKVAPEKRDAFAQALEKLLDDVAIQETATDSNETTATEPTSIDP